MIPVPAGNSHTHPAASPAQVTPAVIPHLGALHPMILPGTSVAARPIR